MSQYNVPERAVPYTVIKSAPINDNWDTIEDALNANYNLAYDAATKVETKADAALIAAENGIATLDENIKLSLSQLPDKAIGKVFVVNTLADQLNLPAYTGDICVRRDIGKTYALSTDGANEFSHWTEIATVNSGGEIGANPCYTNKFNLDSWIERSSNLDYYIEYNENEHGQGSTQFLLVDIKKNNNCIRCDYTISEEGTVVIYSDVPFDGSIMISNLSGNVKNSQNIPYTIMKGPERNGSPAIIDYTSSSLYLYYPVFLIDGLNFIRSINNGISTVQVSGVSSGIYVIFYDSSDINNEYLNNITYINKNNYYGVVNNFPENAIEGQRCYVSYDKSYEFKNGEWSAKAFTPIAEFIIDESGRITNVLQYPYRSNGTNISKSSTCFDYLFGTKLNGLNTVIENNRITTTIGKVLGQDKVISLNNQITKDITTGWELGNNNGCLDFPSMTTSNTAYEVTDGNTAYYTPAENTNLYTDGIYDYVAEGESIYNDVTLQQFYKSAETNEFRYTGNSYTNIIDTTGWGNIFLITNGVDIDIILSFYGAPTLPTGFDNYALIGYFYRDNTSILSQRDFGRKTYFRNPINLDVTNGTIDTDSNNTLIINIHSNEEINITNNDYLIYSGDRSNITIEIPDGSVIDISEDTEIPNIQVLGYINEELK